MPYNAKFKLGGCDKDFHKQKFVDAWIKKSPWKIEYNQFGLSKEAESIRTDLKNYTGFNKSVFPKVATLDRHNRLKVWYGETMIWDNAQEQSLPSADQLMRRIGLIEQNNWTIQNKK